MGARIHTGITDQPLALDAAYRFAGDPGAGAVVVFAGTVRDHAEGREVTGLEYEAFTERAEAQMEAIATDIAERWPAVRAVWIEHRVGTLAVGEPAVVVGVSAGHRPEAFDAARAAIDTLKDTAAIWKKELWADGEARWVGSP